MALGRECYWGLEVSMTMPHAEWAHPHLVYSAWTRRPRLLVMYFLLSAAVPQVAISTVQMKETVAVEWHFLRPRARPQTRMVE